MSHLVNPLATVGQLYQKTSVNALPIELQDSIRYYSARLTQAAGILLGLPQDITAQANVLLFRYWLVDELMQHEYSVRPSHFSLTPANQTFRISPQPQSTQLPKSPPHHAPSAA